jgi:signal transduction histidine kinase
MRLNTKLSLLFFLLTVIPIFVVGFLALENSRRAIEQSTADHLVSTNLLKKAELERWIWGNLLILEMLAKRPFFRNEYPLLLRADEAGLAIPGAAREPIWDQLKTITNEGGIRELFIMRAIDGRVLFSTESTQEGKFLDDQPYFNQGKTGTFIQNVYYAISIQQPAMTISTPLTAPGGETVAVLAGRLDLSQLSAIMEKRNELSWSENTYLVNKFNFYVTEPRFGSGFALKKSIHTQGVLAALAKKDGVGFYSDYRGEPVIGAYQWVPEWELSLITEVAQKEAYSPVRALRKRVFGIAAVISFLAAGLGWLSANTVTTPLRHLVEATEAIDSDKLDLTLDTSGRGEVAELATAFDRMVKRLAQTLVSRDDLLVEVAERKKAEKTIARAKAELERSNDELQQFAYVASHDLQEPLRMISSYTQLLAKRYEGHLDDKAKMYIHYAVDGAARMQRLIQDLLAYSRVNTHRGEFQGIDCHQALGTALVNLQSAIAEKGALVTNSELPCVNADPTQLVQLFQNLLSNGLKFCGEKAPRLHISAVKNGDDWCFSVKDNGIGIDPRYQKRIFDIFQRLHTREEYPGTGIGLSLCKRIVRRHGGKIWFESKPSNGTTFFFTLKAMQQQMPLSIRSGSTDVGTVRTIGISQNHE